jgi:hypothetical protein
LRQGVTASDRIGRFDLVGMDHLAKNKHHGHDDADDDGERRPVPDGFPSIRCPTPPILLFGDPIVDPSLFHGRPSTPIDRFHTRRRRRGKLAIPAEPPSLGQLLTTRPIGSTMQVDCTFPVPIFSCHFPAMAPGANDDGRAGCGVPEIAAPTAVLRSAWRCRIEAFGRQFRNAACCGMQAQLQRLE